MRRAVVTCITLASAVTLAGLLPATSGAGQLNAGRRFAVATESAAASRAAVKVLESGGHAVDAAIAAALVLGVVNPTSSGIGGGGFALVWDHHARKMVALDFRETAPRGIDPQRFERARGDENQRGMLVGVPGEAAGLAELHRRWGRKTMLQNAQPALRAATQGFELEGHMARTLVGYGETLTRTGGIAALFYPNGSPLAEGQRVRNPVLATTIRAFATRGPSAFYSGPIASDIASAVQRHGGTLDESDLANYAVAEREPLHITWEGHDVFTMPPPSAGGLLVAQTLRLIDRRTLVALGEDSPNLIHLLAESFRGSIADRVRAVGDPQDTVVPIAALLSDAHLGVRKQRIGWDRTHAPQRFDLPEHGTSHLVVVDAQRNVVSLTTTVNRAFGARIVAPASGVVLNDELDDFTPPDYLRPFGVAGAGPNAARPGARPVSSMSPTIVMKDGKPFLALGGSGGMRIAPNVAQAAIRVLAFDASAQVAVDKPRFAIGATSTDLIVEPAWLDPRSVYELAFRGERVRASSFAAAVQLVRMQVGPNDSMQAAGDPRKSGLGIVW